MSTPTLREALRRQTERACKFNCDADSETCQCPAHVEYRTALLAAPEGRAEPEKAQWYGEMAARITVTRTAMAMDDAISGLDPNSVVAYDYSRLSGTLARLANAKAEGRAASDETPSDECERRVRMEPRKVPAYRPYGVAVPATPRVVREIEPTPPDETPIRAALFQSRVDPWLLTCFGEFIARDQTERNHRFLEESLELVQSLGCTKSEAHQLVDYVFSRSKGDPTQEAGGVMVTLAALCLSAGLDMHDCGEVELQRVWTCVEKIRAKQAAKPKHSPLPASPVLDARDEELDERATS